MLACYRLVVDLVSQVMAASVGALANGTATMKVQLASDKPVTTYSTIRSTILVPL